MVTSSDGSTFTVTNYQWNTERCYVNNHNERRCFPADVTTQNVTGTNLLAEDAGTITCTVTIDGVDYTSEPLTLRISGTHVRIYVHFSPLEYSAQLIITVLVLSYNWYYTHIHIRYYIDWSIQWWSYCRSN